MDRFLLFMEEHGTWAGPILLALVAGIGWLIKRALDTKPPAPQSNSETTDLAIAALQEKYGREIDDQQQTIDALRKAVDALTEEKSDPEATDTPETIDLALDHLKQGDTAQAEAIFQTILDAKKEEGARANREAAQAAKHIGALAYLHDTPKALSAYAQATQLNPDDAEAWNQLGHLKKLLGDLSGAEQAYEQVLSLGNSSADKETNAIAIGNLGLIARARDDLDKAEDFHSKSLALNEELGRKDGIADQYGNLGLIAQTRGDLDKAEEFYTKVLAIDEELGRKESIAIAYGNLGIIAQDRRDLDKAEDFHTKALTLNKELGLKDGMAAVYCNLGIIAQSRGDLDKAEEFHSKSLALNEELGRKEGIANQCANLGGISKQRGDIAEACRLWRLALGLYTEIGMPHRVAMMQGWLDEAGCDNVEVTPQDGA